jgi:hypothetical protein
MMEKETATETFVTNSIFKGLLAQNAASANFTSYLISTHNVKIRPTDFSFQVSRLKFCTHFSSPP